MKYPLLVIVYLFVLSFSLPAQTLSVDRPRLIVGIMVDGLQQRHIDYLWNYLDSNGIRKLMGEGTQLKNVSYTIVSGGNSSDIASVMTGTIPHYNGVSGDKFYNKNKDKVESIIVDVNQVGVGTSETVSAHRLLSSTIVDELKLTYAMKSKAYAVAIGPEEAIMMGGHTANAVAWIDDVNLKWVGSAYYKDSIPKSAREMNMNENFQILANRVWQPLYSVNTYLNQPINDKKKIGFEYIPSTIKNKKTSQTILKTTPSANTLVAELAYSIFDEEKLGVDMYPDILNLQFTVRIPNETSASLHSIEKEDIYLRLDKDIEKLIRKIEAKIGKENLLVYLYANQTEIHTPAELDRYKIPSGYFNADRTLSLVNLYLMALYGKEQWIKGYFGKNIFLNKEKIEEKKIDFIQLQQSVANFLLEFEGIQVAFPSFTILSMGRNGNSEMVKLSNSAHKSSMGDVIFSLQPGWMEVDSNNNPIGESNASVSNTPLCFYGWKIPSQVINTAYNVTDICPTISYILKIPFPNASTGRVIGELIK